MDDLVEKEPAANQPSKGVSLIAIGHALVTVGLVGLFVTLIMVETPLAAAFRWGACFGLAFHNPRRSRCSTTQDIGKTLPMPLLVNNKEQAVA